MSNSAPRVGVLTARLKPALSKPAVLNNFLHGERPCSPTPSPFSSYHGFRQTKDAESPAEEGFRTAKCWETERFPRRGSGDSAPRVGLEPTSNSLTGSCSTIELPRNVLIPRPLSPDALVGRPTSASALPRNTFAVYPFFKRFPELGGFHAICRMAGLYLAHIR